MDRKWLQEEYAVQRGWHAARGSHRASHLEVGHTRNNDPALHYVVADEIEKASSG
jgi:hypothetical protein